MPGHQPKERIYSLGFQEILLRVGTEVSYQKAVGMLNRLLHREGKAAIKGRTYQDYCQRKGKELAEYQERESEKVLKAAGFDSITGQPLCAEEVPAVLRESGHTEIGEATIRQAAETINAERISTNEQIQSSRQRLEATTETVYISVDEVGVKHQKEQRKQAVEKQGVYVWNTVAVVQSAGKCYTLSGNDTSEVFRNLLAYLLSNQLLESRNLVFFTDGAKNIQRQIETYFSFHPYTIILDWYHLKKRCQEYLSMSVKGGKEQRNAILQKLLRILWAGNVTQASAYLRELDKAVLRPVNRIADLCGYFDKHYQHIPCYALRQRLGLRISSNRVEKANDLVVARRQKHNGMSWSVSGSSALAQISTLFINGDASFWLHHHFLPSFPPLAA